MGKVIKSAGVHVTIDAFVKDPSVFNEETIFPLFDDLVKVLGSKVLAGPYFYEVPLDPEILQKSQEIGEFRDEGGVTAFCVITKSHISIHCWPLQSFFSMDIFSCGEYEPDNVVTIVTRRLRVKSAGITIIRRKKGQKAETEIISVG
jgi:S-adenosylmethionine decarboxylase